MGGGGTVFQPRGSGDFLCPFGAQSQQFGLQVVGSPGELFLHQQQRQLTKQAYGRGRWGWVG